MDASGGRPFEALGRIPGAHACLALAIALAGWLNAIQLWWYVRRADVYAVQPGWRRFLRQLALADVALVVEGGAVVWPGQDWATWPWWSSEARRVGEVRFSSCKSRGGQDT